MDFAITFGGDLSQSTTKSLDIVKKDGLKFQNARCRVQSVQSDWYMDNVGANLESLIGLPNEADTVELGKNLIIASLTEHGLYKPDELYLEIEDISATTLRYLVYLKTEDRRARLLHVTVDALEGVTVEKGGAYVNQS